MNNLSKKWVVSFCIHAIETFRASPNRDRSFSAKKKEFVQLTKFQSHRPLLADLSDRHHFIAAEFTEQCLVNLEKDAGRPLTQLAGGVFQLIKYKLVFANSDERLYTNNEDVEHHLILVVEELKYHGAEGTQQLGSPKPVCQTPEITELLRLLRTAQDTDDSDDQSLSSQVQLALGNDSESVSHGSTIETGQASPSHSESQSKTVKRVARASTCSVEISNDVEQTSQQFLTQETRFSDIPDDVNDSDDQSFCSVAEMANVDGDGNSNHGSVIQIRLASPSPSFSQSRKTERVLRPSTVNPIISSNPDQASPQFQTQAVQQYKVTDEPNETDNQSFSSVQERFQADDNRNTSYDNTIQTDRRSRSHSPSFSKELKRRRFSSPTISKAKKRFKIISALENSGYGDEQQSETSPLVQNADDAMSIDMVILPSSSQQLSAHSEKSISSSSSPLESPPLLPTADSRSICGKYKTANSSPLPHPGWQGMTEVDTGITVIPQAQKDVLDQPGAWWPPTSVDDRSRTETPQSTGHNGSGSPKNFQSPSGGSDTPFSWPESSGSTPSVMPNSHDGSSRFLKLTRSQSSLMGNSDKGLQKSKIKSDKRNSPNGRMKPVTRSSSSIFKTRISTKAVPDPRKSNQQPTRRRYVRKTVHQSPQESEEDESSSEGSSVEHIDPPFPVKNPGALTSVDRYGLLRSQQVVQWQLRLNNEKPPDDLTEDERYSNHNSDEDIELEESAEHNIESELKEHDDSDRDELASRHYTVDEDQNTHPSITGQHEMNASTTREITKGQTHDRTGTASLQCKPFSDDDDDDIPSAPLVPLDKRNFSKISPEIMHSGPSLIGDKAIIQVKATPQRRTFIRSETNESASSDEKLRLKRKMKSAEFSKQEIQDVPVNLPEILSEQRRVFFESKGVVAQHIPGSHGHPISLSPSPETFPESPTINKPKCQTPSNVQLHTNPVSKSPILGTHDHPISLSPSPKILSLEIKPGILNSTISSSKSKYRAPPSTSSDPEIQNGRHGDIEAIKVQNSGSDDSDVIRPYEWQSSRGQLIFGRSEPQAESKSQGGDYVEFRGRLIYVPGYKKLSKEQKSQLSEKRMQYFGTQEYPKILFGGHMKPEDQAEENVSPKIACRGGDQDLWWNDKDTPMKRFVERYKSLKQVRNESKHY